MSKKVDKSSKVKNIKPSKPNLIGDSKAIQESYRKVFEVKPRTTTKPNGDKK